MAVNALAKAGFMHAYNIVNGFEGDRVDDPGSVFHGKHMRNGWKNAGLPWGYDFHPDLMWVDSEGEDGAADSAEVRAHLRGPSRSQALLDRRAARSTGLSTARHVSRGPRRHGTTPSISISSEKLRKVRMSTIRPSTRTFCMVGSTATVRMRSAATRTSRPRRMLRPKYLRSMM